MSKDKQKVSRCFRTRQYAEAYYRNSSYLQTMANQGYNPLVAIQLAFSGQIYEDRPGVTTRPYFSDKEVALPVKMPKRSDKNILHSMLYRIGHSHNRLTLTITPCRIVGLFYCLEKKMGFDMNFIPWRIRTHILKRFLKRRNIIFDSIPSFSGRWPDINNEGKLFIGMNCSFRSFRLHQHISVRKNAELEIGDNSFINDGVNICATQSIRIGHNAKIGDMVYIYDTDFHEVSPDAPIECAPVSIGNNVWIGANSMVLAGAVIGDHSVIAAGSIVTGEIPTKSLSAGSPARVIRTLNIPDGWVRT